MSCEPASVPYFQELDGEHPHYGGGADVSGAHSLSFKNPLAIDFEIREALERENAENDRERAAMTTTSNSTEESSSPKKASKFKSRRCGEWAVILTVIVVIWGLLTLPTIYYRALKNATRNGSVQVLYCSREKLNVCTKIISCPDTHAFPVKGIYLVWQLAVKFLSQRLTKNEFNVVMLYVRRLYLQ